MTAWGVKVKYPGGRSKIVKAPEGTSHAQALDYKIKLMEKTQEKDIEYYVVSLERNA